MLFFGVLIGHRKYPLVKYLIVLLIVAGVILFNYKDGSGRGNGDPQWKLFDLLGAGEVLVVSEHKAAVTNMIQSSASLLPPLFSLSLSLNLAAVSYI